MNRFLLVAIGIVTAFVNAGMMAVAITMPGDHFAVVALGGVGTCGGFVIAFLSLVAPPTDKRQFPPKVVDYGAIRKRG